MYMYMYTHVCMYVHMYMYNVLVYVYPEAVGERGVGKSVRGAGIEHLMCLLCLIAGIHDVLSGRGWGSVPGPGLITLQPPGEEVRRYKWRGGKREGGICM